MLGRELKEGDYIAWDCDQNGGKVGRVEHIGLINVRIRWLTPRDWVSDRSIMYLVSTVYHRARLLTPNELTLYLLADGESDG